MFDDSDFLDRPSQLPDLDDIDPTVDNPIASPSASADQRDSDEALHHQRCGMLDDGRVRVRSSVWGITATTVAVLAELLLMSPRKLFYFTMKKNLHRIKVSKKYIN